MSGKLRFIRMIKLIDKVSKQYCVALLVAVLGAALPGCASTPPALPAAATPAERQIFLATGVARVLARQQDAQAPGVAVIVVKDGKVVLSLAKGMADLGKHAAIEPQTVFDVASLSKSITAIAIMQLVERGKVSLNDSILAWLPELPAAWRDVTIHHLLSHQSGIADITRVSLNAFNAFDGMSNAALIKRYAGAGPLKFPPGSQAEYANINYIFLAEVIGRASGQGYGPYLHEHVFAPANMGSTFLHGEVVPASAKVALNFARTSRSYGIDLATVGATGIFSSVTDMAALLDSLLAGKLVSLATLRTMTQPQSVSTVMQSRYGYGFFIPADKAPMTVFAHTGEVDGYRSFLRVNVSNGVHYVVLSNGGEADSAVMNNIVATIQDAYDRD